MGPPIDTGVSADIGRDVDVEDETVSLDRVIRTIAILLASTEFGSTFDVDDLTVP
jgi:hypothetical protein